MKKAGELLSSIMDKGLFDRLQIHRQLSSSWEIVAQKHRIGAVTDHSRIVDLDRYVVLIEADHPAWIQLLQTKQQGLLESFQELFPVLTITGIAFRLSRKTPIKPEAVATIPVQPAPEQDDVVSSDIYQKIKVDDKDFIESLKRLEKSFRAKNKS
jgi:predicted nucleic acid-binding Zn ribbon protein